MIHLRAARLLPSLPDGTLPPSTEIDLRLHVSGCARCRRRLRELLLADDWVRQLPPSLVPLEEGPTSYARLHALSRWSPNGELPDPEGWRLSVLGVATALFMFCVAASAGSWAPNVGDQWLMGAVSLPQNSTYVPGSYR